MVLLWPLHFESSPVYGAYGSPIKGRAAVRSVTSGGGIETENSIETLEIVDRDSGLTVWAGTCQQTEFR